MRVGRVQTWNVVGVFVTEFSCRSSQPAREGKCRHGVLVLEVADSCLTRKAQNSSKIPSPKRDESLEPEGTGTMDS